MARKAAGRLIDTSKRLKSDERVVSKDWSSFGAPCPASCRIIRFQRHSGSYQGPGFSRAGRMPEKTGFSRWLFSSSGNRPSNTDILRDSWLIRLSPGSHRYISYVPGSSSGPGCGPRKIPAATSLFKQQKDTEKRKGRDFPARKNPASRPEICLTSD